MAGEQTPAAAVFHECIGKLKLEIEPFAAGDSFCVRLPRDDRGIAMDAHFHVVILEDFVFRIVSRDNLMTICDTNLSQP